MAKQHNKCDGKYKFVHKWVKNTIKKIKTTTTNEYNMKMGKKLASIKLLTTNPPVHHDCNFSILWRSFTKQWLKHGKNNFLPCVYYVCVSMYVVLLGWKCARHNAKIRCGNRNERKTTADCLADWLAHTIK